MKLRFFAYFFTIVAALLALPSCETPPSSSDNSEWRRPPRYGSGGSQSRNNRSSRSDNSSSSRNSGSSRFGYSGNERSRPESSSSNSNRDRDRADDDSASADKPKKEEPKKESASSGNSGNLGYAIGVPGKPLSVTLPGAAKSLGPISIEKYDASGNPTGEPLPRGTPVEIPDPNNPGKKIQFKVP